MNKTKEEMTFTAYAKAVHAVSQVVVECARWYNLSDGEMRELSEAVWKKLKTEN